MFLRNSVLSVISSSSHLVISLITGVLVARILGIESKGLIFLIVQIFTILQIIFSFGFGPSILYCVKNKKISNTKVHFFLIIYTLLVLTLCLFAVYIYPEKINNFFGTSLSNEILFIIFSIAFLSTISMLFGFEIMTTDIGVSISINISIVSNIFYLLAIVFSILIFDFSVLSVLISFLISAAVKILLILYYYYKKNKSIEFLNRHDIFLLTDYAARFFVNAFLLTCLFRINIFFINYYSELTEIGYYSVSVNLSELLLIIPSAIGAIFFPHLTGLKREEQIEKMAMMGRINFILGFCGIVILSIIGYPFISLIFGEKFLPAFGPMLALLPGIFSLTLNYSYSNYIISIGRTGVGSVFLGMGLAFNCIASYIFIPNFGIWAAAIISSITYVGITILFITYIVKTEKLSVASLLLPTAKDFVFIFLRFKNVLFVSK